MTAGHFGFAAAVKSKTPLVPLWALMVSTYLLDIVFIILVSSGVESFAPINAAHPSYGGVIIHAYYSHSLVGALIISAIAGLIAKWIWNSKAGLVIGAVAFSHWILDLIVHRPDLPILPGNAGSLPLLGFGLWNIPAASAILELILAVGGAYLYYQSAKNAPGASKTNGGKPVRAYWAAGMTGLLTVLLLASDVSGLSLNAGIIIMLLLIVYCGWLDSKLNWNETKPVVKLEPTV